MKIPFCFLSASAAPSTVEEQQETQDQPVQPVGSAGSAVLLVLLFLRSSSTKLLNLGNLWRSFVLMTLQVV